MCCLILSEKINLAQHRAEYAEPLFTGQLAGCTDISVNPAQQREDLPTSETQV